MLLVESPLIVYSNAFAICRLHYGGSPGDSLYVRLVLNIMLASMHYPLSFGERECFERYALTCAG